MPKTPDNDPLTPPPPPTPERSRPGAFIERDLWSLDDELDETPAPQSTRTVPRIAPAAPKKPAASAEPPAPEDAPAPAEIAAKPRAKATSNLRTGEGRAPLAGAANKEPSTSNPLLSNRRRIHPLDATFSDLDSSAPEEGNREEVWSDARPVADLPPIPAEDSPEEPAETAPAPATSAPEVPPPSAAAEQPPPPEPAAPKSRLKLSRAEKVALAGIAALLAGSALWMFDSFRRNIPTRPSAAEAIAFPIQGKSIQITEASTYWRKPRRDGPIPDAARVESKLIPVLKLKIQGTGQGAIRVFFRNELGDPIGDSITRAFRDGVFTANSSPELEIPATAGFDDEGMYSAYRASSTTPWRVHIHEGPEAKASFQDFHKIIEIPISTIRQ